MRISDWSSDVCSSDLPAVLSRPESLAAIKANAAILVVIQIRDCRRQGTIGRIEGLARQASGDRFDRARPKGRRSEEHTSELQSLMRISYAVFCLKKKKTQHQMTWNEYRVLYKS